MSTSYLPTDLPMLCTHSSKCGCSRLKHKGASTNFVLYAILVVKGKAYRFTHIQDLSEKCTTTASVYHTVALTTYALFQIFQSCCHVDLLETFVAIHCYNQEFVFLLFIFIHIHFRGRFTTQGQMSHHHHVLEGWNKLSLCC